MSPSFNRPCATACGRWLNAPSHSMSQPAVSASAAASSTVSTYLCAVAMLEMAPQSETTQPVWPHSVLAWYMV